MNMPQVTGLESGRLRMIQTLRYQCSLRTANQRAPSAAGARVCLQGSPPVLCGLALELCVPCQGPFLSQMLAVLTG